MLSSNKNTQQNKGIGNINAGRDVIIAQRHPLQFDPDDLSHVIECFSSNLDEATTRLTELANISKEEKNRINGMSSDYFDLLQERLMPYLQQISNFLTDYKNKELRRKYQESVGVLKMKIVAYRGEFSSFERIMEHLADDMYAKCKHHTGISRHLVGVFLDYMYFTCDIGKTR